MTAESARPRVPINPGYFTIPDDPEEPPRLLGSKCEACGEHYFPRRAICARPECLSERVIDVELGPHGTLYSYTFVHLPLFGSTNLAHMDGYGVGQVDLTEGPRVQFPLAGKQAEFRIGQTLQAELDVLREDGGNDVVIVRFRPLEGPAVGTGAAGPLAARTPEACGERDGSLQAPKSDRLQR